MPVFACIIKLILHWIHKPWRSNLHRGLAFLGWGERWWYSGCDKVGGVFEEVDLLGFVGEGGEWTVKGLDGGPRRHWPVVFQQASNLTVYDLISPLYPFVWRSEDGREWFGYALPCQTSSCRLKKHGAGEPYDAYSRVGIWVLWKLQTYAGLKIHGFVVPLSLRRRCRRPGLYAITR